MHSPHLTALIQSIAAAKARADALAGHVSHRGLEGQIREIALRECIEPFLTQSFSCSTGKVIDTRRSISDQIDLVVFHRKVAPPILVSRDLGLFPVECVRYVFETKSTLTARAIRDANKKFRSIANLVSFPKTNMDGQTVSGQRPVTVLFAFGSDISGSEIQRYIKHTPDSSPPCTVICVLGKAYWYFDHANKQWLGADVQVPQNTRFLEFAAFITGFMNTLASDEASLRAFSPGSYVDADFLCQPFPSPGADPSFDGRWASRLPLSVIKGDR